MSQTNIIAGNHILELVQDSANYNAWANNRLVEWLRTKPASLLEETVPSSFSSLKETLLHIWDVQRFWLANIQQVPPPPTFRFGYDGTLEDILNGIVENSNELAAYLSQLSSESVQSDRHFLAPTKWPEWEAFERAAYQLLQHTVVHSAYHRGQIITIGHQLNLKDAPMTDYMYYLLLGKDSSLQKAA